MEKGLQGLCRVTLLIPVEKVSNAHSLSVKTLLMANSMQVSISMLYSSCPSFQQPILFKSGLAQNTFGEMW